jgi:hypothetical protein
MVGIYIRVIELADFFMLCWGHGTIGIIVFKASGLAESTLALGLSAFGFGANRCHNLACSDSDLII